MARGFMSVGVMAPFYVFPCGHVFHSDCLIAHVSLCTNATQAENILELQKQLSLLGNPPSNMNGHHIDNGSVSSLNTVEKIQSQLDEAIASECPFCGDLMIRKIYMPFILLEEVEQATSWEIKPQLVNQRSLPLQI